MAELRGNAGFAGLMVAHGQRGERDTTRTPRNRGYKADQSSGDGDELLLGDAGGWEPAVGSLSASRNPCAGKICRDGAVVGPPPKCACCAEPGAIKPMSAVAKTCAERVCPCPDGKSCVDVPKHVWINYLSESASPTDSSAPCDVVSTTEYSACAENRAGDPCGHAGVWRVPGCGCLKQPWNNGSYPPLCPSILQGAVSGTLGFDCCDPCPGGMPLQNGTCHYPKQVSGSCGIDPAWSGVDEAYSKSIAYALANGLLSGDDVPGVIPCPVGGCANAQWYCLRPAEKGAARVKPAAQTPIGPKCLLADGNLFGAILVKGGTGCAG